MGFYNILRIVKSVLYRTPKKILITIIICLVLFMFNSHVFGASVQDVSTTYKDDEGFLHIATNQYLYFVDKQRQAQIDFITSCYGYQNSSQYTTVRNGLNVILSEMRNIGNYGKGLFVYETPSSTRAFTVSIVLISNMENVGIYNYGTHTATGQVVYVDDVPVVKGMTYPKVIVDRANWSIVDNAVEDDFCYYELTVFAKEWIQLFKDFGLISDKDDEIIALLTQIANKSEQDYSNALAQVNQNLENIDSSVKDTNQSIKDMQNSITDSSVDVPVNDLPKDNTQDITDVGFNQIFELLRTTFTTSEPKDLVVELPFVHKSFTINSANVYGNADLGIVKVLIQSFWYFVFCYFIVQDISIKINKLKSGNIEDVQTDNVKEDIL